MGRKWANTSFSTYIEYVAEIQIHFLLSFQDFNPVHDVHIDFVSTRHACHRLIEFWKSQKGTSQVLLFEPPGYWGKATRFKKNFFRIFFMEFEEHRSAISKKKFEKKNFQSKLWLGECQQPYYIFAMKGVSIMMKLWKHYMVEFHAELYMYQMTGNSKIVFSVKYIPAFVNNQIFWGLLFNELIIKCFRSFKPSLAMKY